MEVPEVRKGGRPSVVDDFVLSQLTFAFARGASDAQACLYAGIAPATLYRYEDANPEFREHKHLLKESLTLQAKMNVAEKINAGNIMESQWWLERKAKDEFSTRTENINANISVDKLSEEERERIKNVIHANTQSGSIENTA